jgi:uncharacterized protein YukE
MYRFEVDTGQLAGAGGYQHTAATQVADVSSRVNAIAASAAGAAGDPGLAGAIDSLAASWTYGLNGLAASIDALATNLEGASAAYETTDRSAMPGAGH